MPLTFSSVSINKIQIKLPFSYKSLIVNLKAISFIILLSMGMFLLLFSKLQNIHLCFFIVIVFLGSPYFNKATDLKVLPSYVLLTLFRLFVPKFCPRVYVLPQTSRFIWNRCINNFVFINLRIRMCDKCWTHRKASAECLWRIWLFEKASLSLNLDVSIFIKKIKIKT